MRSAIGHHGKLLLIAAGLIIAAPITFNLVNAAPNAAQSQTQNTTAASPVYEFDVASVKPAKSPDGPWRLSNTNDGLDGLNVPLLYLIQSAYGVFEKDRLLGVPSWASSENFDITAKMDPATVDALQKLSKEQRSAAILQMFQGLMADRFKLRVHHETRELPIYLLVVAKSGPKLQDAPPDPTGEKHPLWDGTMRGGAMIMIAHQMPMQDLANRLTGPSGRKVLDKTGLAGKYEFTLQFNLDESQSDSSVPSLFTAIQEQLGLKFEPGKSTVDVIVVDHVERPSGN